MPAVLLRYSADPEGREAPMTSCDFDSKPRPGAFRYRVAMEMLLEPRQKEALEALIRQWMNLAYEEGEPGLVRRNGG